MTSLLQLRPDFACYLPSEYQHGGLTQAHFVHEEVFALRSYLREGVHLPPGSVVLDVGANIGLFSVFVKQECPDARVLAFEPLPETAEALRRNVVLHGIQDVEVHELALGAERGTAEFAFDPALSCNATSHPEEKEVLATLRRHLFGEDGFDTVVVPVDTLSAVLSRAGVTKVDLLKIDVEGAELDVLRGVGDWAAVRQVVVESGARKAGAVADLLRAQGFTTVVRPAPILVESTILPKTPGEPTEFLIYATRP